MNESVPPANAIAPNRDPSKMASWIFAPSTAGNFPRMLLTRLVRTIYAVLRDDCPSKDPQLNDGQPLVHRNAPHWTRMSDHNGLLAAHA